MEIFLWLLIVVLCVVSVWQQVQIRKQKTHTLQLKNQISDLKPKLQKTEQSSEAKSRYLSGITHELRAPLNVIMGYAQLLEQQASNSDTDQKKFTLMRQNCEHLSHIIEGLLEFSAMEAGKLKVQSDTFNLPDLLSRLQNTFQLQAIQKDLKFECLWPENLPTWVKTDSKRLHQILINLLSNAIKFTDKGHICFDVSYRNQVATFKVSDSGNGIAASDLEKIFTPFERLGKSNQNIPGTGLGLPISRLLSDLLGGELTVASELNKGSTFTLKIMLSPQVKNTLLSEEQTELKIKESKSHILVVDDEATHGQLLLELLASLNFKASTSSHADDALKQLQLHHFDLCILDINMPDCDGWALAKKIRTTGFKSPIVMLSGNARDQAPSGQTHHQAYLTKPVKIDQLKKCVSQLLKIKSVPKRGAHETHITKQIQPVQLSHDNRIKLQRLISIGHINGIEAHVKNMYADGQLDTQTFQNIMQAVGSYNIQSIKDLFNHE